MVFALIVLYRILQVYYYFLIASVLMSWIPELKRSKFGQIIDQIADPYMRLFRGFLIIGVLDFTPILGFLLYSFGLQALAFLINTL
jgi:YggT family protein